jgi:hypothetical protein
MGWREVSQSSDKDDSPSGRSFEGFRWMGETREGDTSFVHIGRHTQATAIASVAERDATSALAFWAMFPEMMDDLL